MICVEDLHFSYDKENEVINGISLSIKKGKNMPLLVKVAAENLRLSN